MNDDASATKTEADKTSAFKTATHNAFCSVCKVWYARAEPCPKCGRGMLLG